MFGYVRIKKDNLLVKDYNLYNKKYCSLCHSLGKEYGIFYRLLTSYDLILLILCLEMFEDDNIYYNHLILLENILQLYLKYILILEI